MVESLRNRGIITIVSIGKGRQETMENNQNLLLRNYHKQIGYIELTIGPADRYFKKSQKTGEGG
jgi:hypothetical protein